MPYTTKSFKVRFEDFFVLQGKKRKIEHFFLQGTKLFQKRFYKNHLLIFRMFLIRTLPIVSIKRIKRKQKILREIPFIMFYKSRIFNSFNVLRKLMLKKSALEFKKNYQYLLIGFCKNSIVEPKSNEEMHEQAFNLRKYSNYRWF